MFRLAVPIARPWQLALLSWLSSLDQSEHPGWLCDYAQSSQIQQITLPLSYRQIMSKDFTTNPEISHIEDLNAPEFYINREISLLDFQYRVLAEAKDESYPLLERVKFLAYVYHNLDEFFMVRVGGLQMQDQAGVSKLSQDGLTPADQLALARKKAGKLLTAAQACWTKQIKPALDEAGVHIVAYEDLSKKQRKFTKKFFQNSIFPTLTPLAFDPGHPFPHISNLSLNLAVFIEDQDGEQHFARVKIPTSFPRFLPIKKSSGSVRKDGTVPHNHYFVLSEQVIANNLEPLFPGMKILETHPFRIIRNNDMEIQEIEAGDLLETMEESVRKRRFGKVVQLAVDQNISKEALGVLTANLKVERNDIFTFAGELGLSQLMELTNINRFDLQSEKHTPYVPPKLRIESDGEDIFSVIRQGDVLIHHPYDSFDPVVKFIESAASDPRVLAIKQTLYRTGSNSPIVQELLREKTIGLAKQISPALIVDQQLRNRPTALQANGITYAATANGNFGAKEAYKINTPLQEIASDVTDLRASIKETCFNDLFNMFSNLDTVRSAAEIGELKGEKLVHLGPVYQRFEGEVLDPTLKRVYSIALAKGLLPEPPQELDGAQIEFFVARSRRLLTIAIDSMLRHGAEDAFLQVAAELPFGPVRRDD